MLRCAELELSSDFSVWLRSLDGLCGRDVAWRAWKGSCLLVQMARHGDGRNLYVIGRGRLDPPTITSRGGLRTSGLQLGILAIRGFNCTMARASKKNKRICHWLSIRQPDQKTAQPRVVEHRVLRTLTARFHTPPSVFATLKKLDGRGGRAEETTGRGLLD